MYNTCYRITGDEMEAEDIMQESFLVAFEKINTYKGEVSFGAWLKKIVINKSLDTIKKKKIELVPIDDKILKIKKEENNEEDAGKYKIEAIRNAIEQLADGYRIVLSLYLLEGYDHDEISQILNISSSNSRSQLSRAKQRLKEILKNEKY